MIPERLRPLLEETAPRGERFAGAGWRLYLVGGSVRDAILGHPFDPGDDVDFITDAHPHDIEAVVKGWAEAAWRPPGTRAGGSAPSESRRMAASTRSPPTGPRRIRRTPASPRCSSPMRSRPTCPGATSPSTPWPSRFPTPS